MTEWTNLPEPYAAFSMPDDTDLAGPGVYRWWRSTGESYIGKASSLLSRLGDHRRAGMLTVIEGGAIYPTETIAAADTLERTLIWLLDPSENIQRPTPSGPLWAATLGQARPVDGWSWSWYRECGHVKYGGHYLIEPLDAMRSACGCVPWLAWFDAARSAAEGMQAQITALTEQIESSLVEEVEELEQPIALYDPAEELHARVVEQDAELEQARERMDALQDEINRLEVLRERSNWEP